MKQMSAKAKKILVALGLLLAAAVGMTVAFYASRKTFDNEFRVKKPGVAVVEKFNPADHWVPGEEKSKQVWFTNTGEQDMLLRFSVKAEWDPATPHPNDGRSPESVVTLYWNTGEGNRGEGVPADFTKISQNGIEYYYYTKVLKAGESTQHVLESVKFAANLSNSKDGHENSDYSGTQINLTITGETVLADAEAEAAAELWNVMGKIDGDTVTWAAN